ncbi:StbD Antitoxin of toxin-antitoxin stability system [uncultured Caudovirales phage]|jgi:prevent-host-death family protein|uniref:StbD Antitoxin of toxin-antitoxin stability system n=1 Tax=uncultured Caudovirales phage TaxID=2100421 RepID=A0A6J7X8S8_9CAUD|nr:StbD Antitoxin of toxin-antitoxin stability system [uncultured Caudovirales phage]CAB4176246.1 StbD Antitoxin of toxin-antitoxin stability system [uncultured Caudovirales phage]CAB4180849.1 StbD Antitoxin of toxin-antitoxin stability system [uncultured Caudovirales phage]CAB4198345.1 StbD Antitoxin of toxin-antitoxin stability system [uncultured Caudovirales phage]CAB4210385.1 StbD Antitoxin of toxin-antitoxin stability system [uncultured Caudovirales phage]
MEIYNTTQARANLFKLIDYTVDSHEPVYIVGKKNKAVLISEEDYNSIQETLYLLKSPKNAILLYKAMEEVKQKKFIKKDLKDLMNE